MRESGQLLDEIERKKFEIIRVQKREVQSRRIEGIYDIVDGLVRRLVMNDSGATDGADASVKSVSFVLINIVEV